MGGPDDQTVGSSDNRQSRPSEIKAGSRQVQKYQSTNSLDVQRAKQNWNLSFNPKKFGFGDKACICDECEMEFSNVTYIKAHKDTVHKGIQYSCYLCYYMSPYKYNLNKHTK